MSTQSISRRTALKFSSAIALIAARGHTFPHDPVLTIARGYGRDPNLFQRPVTWTRVLSASQQASITALSDIILPADPPHPSASAIGVPDFLDEWVSAPYPQMQADGLVITGGLAALEGNALSRLGVPFAAADRSHQFRAFEACCQPNDPGSPFAQRLIQLVCGGYYTTHEGFAAIGYVGNTALARFPGASAEAVQRFESVLR